MRVSETASSFERLFERWDWGPIRGCPGRYVLRDARKDLRPRDVLGAETGVTEFTVPAAGDGVLVATFAGGGLLSYRRADGSFVHTLNTTEGLRRKLAQLGIGKWPAACKT